MKNATSRPTTLVLAAAWLYRGKLPPPQSTDTTLQSSTSYIADIFIPLSYPSLLYPLPPLLPSPQILHYSPVHLIQQIYTFLYPTLPSPQILHYSPVHLIYQIYLFLLPFPPSSSFSFPLLISIPFQVSIHPIASYPPLYIFFYPPIHSSNLFTSLPTNPFYPPSLFDSRNEYIHPNLTRPPTNPRINCF